jgi:hypothetical protein
MSTVRAIESRVLEVERFAIRVVDAEGRDVRGDRAVSGDFAYERAADGGITVAEWIQRRTDWLPGDLRVQVLKAGEPAHGRTTLATVREARVARAGGPAAPRIRSTEGFALPEVEEAIRRLERMNVRLTYGHGRDAHDNRRLPQTYPFDEPAPDAMPVQRFVFDRFKWLPDDLRAEVLDFNLKPIANMSAPLKEFRRK